MENFLTRYNYGITFKINGVLYFWTMLYKAPHNDDYIKMKVKIRAIEKFGKNINIEFIGIKKVN